MKQGSDPPRPAESRPLGGLLGGTHSTPLAGSVVPILVLASASPRRMDLLRAAGIPHAVHPTEVDETPHPGEAPQDFAARVAQAKADAAAPRYPTLPVLAGDTVVVAQGATLGKPPHDGAARQMLHMLSGSTHRVLTAYHLRYRDGDGALQRIARVIATEVDVRPLSGDEIDAYLRSEEWRGKAGSYAIQGRFGCFVRGIRGSYDNVVGLPVCQVIEDLKEAGVLRPPGSGPGPAAWPGWRP